MSNERGVGFTFGSTGSTKSCLVLSLWHQVPQMFPNIWRCCFRTGCPALESRVRTGPLILARYLPSEHSRGPWRWSALSNERLHRGSHTLTSENICKSPAPERIGLNCCTQSWTATFLSGNGETRVHSSTPRHVVHSLHESLSIKVIIIFTLPA